MTARARLLQDFKSDKFTPYQNVNSLVSTEGAALWPCQLPNFHRQLKNYISTAIKDTIFYVSSYDAYAIHTPTNRRVQVTTVSFTPTCLAAGYGWLCLGAYSNGKCAFIDLRSCDLFGMSTEPWSAEVDTSLPLDLDIGSRALPDQHANSPDPTTFRRAPKIINEEIGTMIVNGITISKFVSNDKDRTDDTVAVISNNDKTVTIYSLTQQIILQTINLSKEINQASISPDGELLVVVGDVNKVWFYQRKMKVYGQKHRMYEWEEIAVVRIEATIEKDWSFSTAWSPSGHICMVASQFGVITVFESSKIKKDMSNSDAILFTMTSSRPSVAEEHLMIPGAPRSMAFSPGPWDLVAWAEDHGRVTIADLRDGFGSRQTIQVDVHSDKVKRITCVPVHEMDLHPERDLLLIQRHRDALDSNDPQAAIRHAADYIADAVAARRHARSAGIYSGPGQQLHHSVLSDSERELMELVQSEAARDTLEGYSLSRPYSINYSDQRSSGSSRQTSNFLQNMAARADTRGNASHMTMPRRRGSVVMSQNTAERTARTSAAHPSSLTPGFIAPLSTSPARLNETSRDDLEVPAYHSSNISRLGSRRTQPLSDTGLDRPRHRRLTDEIMRITQLRNSNRSPTSDIGVRWRAVASLEPQNLEASQRILEERERALNDRERVSRERTQALEEGQRTLREYDRTWNRRIYELRERAGRLSESFGNLSREDMSFLDEVTSDIMLGSQTISRAREAVNRSSIDDEISLQGIGWSWDGRYL